MNEAQRTDRENLIDRCIQDCRICHSVCVATLSHCLRMGGEHADERHIIALQDCADLCKLSEDALIRSSDMMERICRLCGDVCISCAESCESFKDDRSMALCAETCRTCADSCRKLSRASEAYGSRLTSFS
ncbi:MAG TPA: four-helix bundle copper-binding protein [Methanomassiliicoccaceae archaeon]|jgi:hypothetical protein|nr:four-helix bundle copper-binding protein [Euryarchaeota archaeon]HOB37749.1 four-helix bundle copper-binding protein [Methanomassiliicoccaceae archaeon]HOQ25403.1 four-helix bundle copper-binding protein [Methanomassiliicoccaceae archaeon]HPT75022.1 four-helix bundle copper-binding protein [Methanomassiliicoccaceae archaeon]HQA20662.1 four-helix bundle copper-binding protein [Methanomassiliicoccaceae archaeon]